MKTYNGFDPLEAAIAKVDKHTLLINEAKKREINNILKCYTGYFDIFSELLQNALDATEKIWKDNKEYEPVINVDIDLVDLSITVSDNGIGMTQEEFEFCLAPNMSFKKNDFLRGNKGVGITFVAYGFNNIKIHTKSKNFETRVKLLNGRRWIDDINGDIERPRFEDIADPFNSFLNDKQTGTIFRITLDKGEKPKLDYINATTAEQWLSVLRIRTPLGGIYLRSTSEGQFKPKIHISVKDYNGKATTKTSNGADYFYPHEIPNLKVESINDIEKSIDLLVGSPYEKFQKLSDNYKRLNALYEIWDWETILKDEKCKIKNNLSDEEIDLIRRHKVSIYGFYCHSTRIFDRFNDDYLKIRKGYKVMKGGLQMASDGMPQGDLINIQLGKSPGNQSQGHIIVHFENGEPDLGRKTFQEEKNKLASKFAENIINLFRKYRNHLKADETSEPLTPDKEKYDWIKDQESYYEKFPLIKPKEFENIHILSRPQKEQDVIALFNQLLGSKILKGIEIFATSEHQRYDSVFRLNYKENSNIHYSSDNVLGVSPEMVPDLPWNSEPKILEYKYDFDALVRECISNDKFHKHIDLVVTWNVSQNYQDKVELKSLLIEERAIHQRTIYGSTHLAYLYGHYERPIYEVLVLEDMINYLIDPNKEKYNQEKYSEI